MAHYFYSSVFCSFPARQLFPMGALFPRRRRCSIDLQRDFRVLAAAFFYGLILWLAVQSDSHPAPLFSPFFSGKAEKNGPPEAQLRCRRERGSPVNPDKRGRQGRLPLQRYPKSRQDAASPRPGCICSDQRSSASACNAAPCVTGAAGCAPRPKYARAKASNASGVTGASGQKRPPSAVIVPARRVASIAAA